MTVLVRAAAATGRRPSLWVVALCGFLARGGILLLALPAIRLPSTVGMATLVGPTSVTAAGLTEESAVRVVAVVGAVVAWIVVGHAVGAMTDEAVVAGFRLEADGSPAVGAARRGRLVRLVAIRLASLVPLGVVAAVTARAIGELVYQELILPRDLATPLVIRVVQGAQVQVAALVVAWVAGEALAGIAVRLAILEDRSFGRSIRGAVAHVARRPLTTLLCAVAGSVGSLVALGLGLLAAASAWDALTPTFQAPIDGSAVVRATIVTVAAWAWCGILSAVVATWRGALWTMEVARPA